MDSRGCWFVYCTFSPGWFGRGPRHSSQGTSCLRFGRPVPEAQPL
jgi:hypothetical protein